MLQTTLGNVRLLAHPNDRRLWLMDALAAELWDLQGAGWTAEALAGLLEEHFGLDATAAHTHVTTQQALWRQAGLWDARVPQTVQLGELAKPEWPAPCLRPLSAGAVHLRVADRDIGLSGDDSDLMQTLYSLLTPKPDPPPFMDLVDHRIHLHGHAATWRLALDNLTVKVGHGPDAALATTISVLTELGSRPIERLLVVHGAGLMTPDRRGLLLIAPGGSGKSTLAAALNTHGFALLSDDVVPVTPVGELLGLGLPLCLKAGSWPVLAKRRPELDRVSTQIRFGQQVRYLLPYEQAVIGPLIPRLYLFPRYCPDQASVCKPLPPEQVLQGLIAAGAVIRDLSQDKLENLARWVDTAPAYALSYPDLDCALALVGELIEHTA